MSNETGASAVDSTTSPANEHDYPSSASTPASSRSEPYLARSATSTGTAATPRESGQILGEDLPPVKLERTSSVSDEYLRFLGQPGSVEKRFPVDRKKLERMIVAGGKYNESAEEYFQRIMDQTSTLILWPSKLKIGAKSKKDPQVKVVGPYDGVQLARELVLTDLDAKSNRVTLKIDVPSTEHSHVIGKEGANIKKVHEETACHIHFPDSNRSMQADKSNQVSITGSVSAVELARKRVRELLPVVVSFTLGMPGPIDTNPPEIAQLNLTYNVQIHIKPQPRQYSMMVVIRGTMKFVDGLKVALAKVVECFTDDYLAVPDVSLHLDVAVQHHHTLIGNAGGNIRKIMQDTATTIHFPDPSARYLSTQVVIQGSVGSVFEARDQLLGCLPVVLLFDIYDTEENKINSAVIGELMQYLDVFISVKPKTKQQTIQSIIVKSIEQNLQCVFQTRSRLLDLSNQPVRHHTISYLPPVVEKDPRPIAMETDGDHKSVEVSRPWSEEPLRRSEVPLRHSEAPLRRSEAPLQCSEVPLQSSEAPCKSPSPKAQHGDDTGNDLSPGGSGEGQRDRPALSGPAASSAPAQDSGEGAEPPENTKPRADTTPPPPPTEGVKQSLTTTSSSGTVAPPKSAPKLTTRVMLDYNEMRKSANQLKAAKVTPNEPRYPTHFWAGRFLSDSMPAERLQPLTTSSITSTSPPSSVLPNASVANSTIPQPLGLSSLNTHGFKGIARQGSQKSMTSEQEMYRDISDITTLLRKIGLEKYQSCFDEEEVDFTAFLTMTESDFKEIGISTLGARRKLQIAILELKKLNAKPGSGGVNPAGGGRAPFRAHHPPVFDKGGSLKRSGNFSHSVRF